MILCQVCQQILFTRLEADLSIFLSNPFQILQHSVNKSRMLNQFG